MLYQLMPPYLCPDHQVTTRVSLAHQPDKRTAHARRGAGAQAEPVVRQAAAVLQPQLMRACVQAHCAPLHYPQVAVRQRRKVPLHHCATAEVPIAGTATGPVSSHLLLRLSGCCAGHNTEGVCGSVQAVVLIPAVGYVVLEVCAGALTAGELCSHRAPYCFTRCA